MNGIAFKTFSNIEDDIQKEYGDVHNELVVQTHGTIFLSAKHAPWDIVNAEFNRIVNLTISHLPPSVTQEAYDAYAPVAGHKCTPPADASFDAIIDQIISENAAEVHLLADEQSFWVMDIKRLFPDIYLSVMISSLLAAKRAAHMNQFIDEVITAGPGVAKSHGEMITALMDVFGKETFSSHPKQDVFK